MYALHSNHCRTVTDARLLEDETICAGASEEMKALPMSFLPHHPRKLAEQLATCQNCSQSAPACRIDD